MASAIVDVEGLKAEILQRGFDAMAVALSAIRDQKRDDAPVREGYLRNSIEMEGPYDQGNAVTGAVFTDTEYASYLDQGTDPHYIVGNPLLHFYWDKVGKNMTLPFVWHPGSQIHVGWWGDLEPQFIDELQSAF